MKKYATNEKKKVSTITNKKEFPQSQISQGLYFNDVFLIDTDASQISVV